MSEMLYDILEICLKELEDGADLESVLARHPQYSDELRPILKASIKARGMAAPQPSPDTVHRGRARLLQRAAEIRETAMKPGVSAEKPRKSVFPFVQRLTIALSLVVFFCAATGIGGIGVLSASASALPGDGLYPVKRGWENARLIFTINPEARSALEAHFYSERLSEVTRLLAEGRLASVEFAGTYWQADGQVYVSGIQVVIIDSTVLPVNALENGMAVLVRGSTTTSGTVEADSIQVLINPAVVPSGDFIPATPTPVRQATPSPSPTAIPTFTVQPTPTSVPAVIVPTSTPAANQNNNSNDNDNDNDDDSDDDDNINDD